MTSGVANVRTNFYSGSLIDTPTGWLFNKKSGLLILFESYKKSFEDINKIIDNKTIQKFICNIDKNLIGIKATTNEKLGPEGREEGISCHSVVLLEKNEI